MSDYYLITRYSLAGWHEQSSTDTGYRRRFFNVHGIEDVVPFAYIYTNDTIRNERL